MARGSVRYALAVVLLVSAYYAVPGAQPWLVGSVELLAVAAIEYGVRHWRPQRAGAWHLLAVSVALLGIGDYIFEAIEAGSPAPVTYPSVPDIFYIAAYLPLTVALFWFGQSRGRRRDVSSLVDAIAVTLAASLVVWILVVRPGLQDESITLTARFAAVGAWVGYVAVLVASVRLVLSWRHNASVGLLSIGVVVFVVSEVLYGQALVQGTWTVGGPVDLGYFTFAALCGAAALHPSMRDLASPAYARLTLGPWRLTMIAVALLVGPTALMVEASLGTVRTGFAIGIISGLVSVLVLIRLGMAGRAYQRRAAREGAVRLGSQAMASAITPADVVAGTRSALSAVERHNHVIDVAVVDPRGLDTHQPSAAQPYEPILSGPGDRGELTIPLTGSDTALVFAALIDDLADLADLLRALTDQAAVTLQRIHLAEAAGAEERDRYFRSLVLTSTDVILISRDGRIEYATPSAQTLFCRNVLGERFDAVVHPTHSADHRPPQVDAGPERPLWPDTADDTEATITRPDGERIVLVQRRDLTGDPAVRGVVTTMRDVTAERELQRDLAYRASHDELTGLANMRTWGETLAAESDRRHGPGDSVAILLIDLDDFKHINDRHGHLIGDEVLAEAARRINDCVRPGDRAARIGGDEFAVLLRGLSGVDAARTVAQHIADALSHPVVVDSVSVVCHGSVGLAYSDGAERVRTLVRRADTALYAAKDQGKGRWTEYSPERGARG